MQVSRTTHPVPRAGDSVRRPVTLGRACSYGFGHPSKPAHLALLRRASPRRDHTGVDGFAMSILGGNLRREMMDGPVPHVLELYHALRTNSRSRRASCGGTVAPESSTSTWHAQVALRQICVLARVG